MSACGFDSIPADKGTIDCEEKFSETVNSIETYMRAYQIDNYQLSGAVLHYGTWDSIVYALAYASKLLGITKQLFPTKLPRFTPKLKRRPVIHKSKFVGNLWTLPFPGSDVSVVM